MPMVGTQQNSVPVPMVDVRVMRMLVRQGKVGMLMTVWFGAVPRRLMRVLMVRIVHMAMCMYQRLMGVLVCVPLGQVQPNPQPHQRTGQPESGRRGFSQKHHRHGRTHERRS